MCGPRATDAPAPSQNRERDQRVDEKNRTTILTFPRFPQSDSGGASTACKRYLTIWLAFAALVGGDWPVRWPAPPASAWLGRKNEQRFPREDAGHGGNRSNTRAARAARRELDGIVAQRQPVRRIADVDTISPSSTIPSASRVCASTLTDRYGVRPRRCTIRKWRGSGTVWLSVLSAWLAPPISSSPFRRPSASR